MSPVPISIDGSDPITIDRSHGPGDDLSLPGTQLSVETGHHRVEEIGRRVREEGFDTETVIEVVQPR